MIDGFGTQVEGPSLEDIGDELMSLVRQGLLDVGMDQSGEVVFWKTEAGEDHFGNDE